MPIDFVHARTDPKSDVASLALSDVRHQHQRGPGALLSGRDQVE
jgi:hypothetical protein